MLKSSSKNGGIVVQDCGNSKSNLYPLSVSPKEWLGCGDAYTHTWTSDFERQLFSLGHIDKLKLIKSSGFCPQNRCQLDNISNQLDIKGNCPEGLCYSKIEVEIIIIYLNTFLTKFYKQNGGLSFGACCFIDGKFLSGDIIGYYNKSQPAPKPIYDHSRIILGGKESDDNFVSFINANKVV